MYLPAKSGDHSKLALARLIKFHGLRLLVKNNSNFGNSIKMWLCLICSWPCSVASH